MTRLDRALRLAPLGTHRVHAFQNQEFFKEHDSVVPLPFGPGIALPAEVLLAFKPILT
jgi:hypothetical protein